MPPSRAARFGWNMAWNVAAQIVLVFLGFFLVPYLVKGLGKNGYALYGYLGLISGNLLLLAFGASQAVTRFSAEAIGRNDSDGLSRTISAGFLLSSVGVLIAALVLCALRRQAAGALFGESPEAVLIVVCAAAAGVFVSWSQFGAAVFQGLQRFGPVNLLKLFQGGGVLTAAAVLLFLGKGIREISFMFVLLQALAAAAALWAASRASRSVGAVFGVSPGKKVFSEMAAFGGSAFLAQLCWSVVFQWDKLLIGAFLSLDQLAYYLIPSFLLQRLWVVPSTVADVAVPMMSEMSGRGEIETMGRFYRVGSRLVLWAAVPGFFLLALFAPQALTLWISGEFSTAGTWPLRWLCLGYMFYLAALLPSSSSYAFGFPRYSTAWSGVQAAVSALSWPFLIGRFGIVGAAAGFCLGQAAAGIPYCLFVSRRFFGISPLEYARSVVAAPVLIGLAVCAVLWPLKYFAYEWLGLILLCAAGTVLYGAGAFLSLNEDERRMLSRLRGKKSEDV